ncbi:MAG: hypothetical protein V1790_10670 [Planctomycetota bacterium]
MRSTPLGILVCASVFVMLAQPPSVLAGTCACNSDVSNNGSVQFIDVVIVAECARTGTCTGCVNDCDIDCDGDVDYYDAGVAACAFDAQSNCCAEADGACTGANNSTPACVITTDNFCSLFSGAWHGNNSICVGAEAVEIPTVSTWGLLALGVSILIAATLVIQRRALCKAVA